MTSTHDTRSHSSDAVGPVRRTPKHDVKSTTTPLIDASDLGPVPQGWPKSPNRIRTTPAAILFNVIFDILLLACAGAFLVFAQIVIYHDQARTSEKVRATSMLRSATKYVRLSSWCKSRRAFIEQTFSNSSLTSEIGPHNLSPRVRVDCWTSSSCDNEMAVGERRTDRDPRHARYQHVPYEYSHVSISASSVEPCWHNAYGDLGAVTYRRPGFNPTNGH
jgi:hypothetical protein